MGSAGSGSTKPSAMAKDVGFYLSRGNYPQDLNINPTTGLPTGGYFADVAAQQMLPIEQLFGGAQDFLNQANMAGQNIQGMAAQGAGQAYAGANQLAQNLGQGGLETAGNMLGAMPGYQQAAQQYAGGINQAQGNYGNTIGQANQLQSRLMDPTKNNEFYKNAMENQSRLINSAASMRGMASSGPAMQAISEAGQNLNLELQNQQANQAIQNLGNLSSLIGGQGQLGTAAAQVPGQVYNQFAQGLGGLLNQGSQGIMQALGAPLAAAQQGAQAFQTGLDIPMQMIQNWYNLSRDPMKQMAGFATGTPSISGNVSHGLLSGLFK